MNYHNYFLYLEEKFIEISKFVEIDPSNYSAYSTEILLAFVTTCSEFEVVSKELCKIISGEGNCSDYNIVKIHNCLSELLPDVLQEKIILRPYPEMELTPLQRWTPDIRPDWWKAYNDVKHNRSDNYAKANLENLLNALAALEIINIYLIWKRDCPRKNKTSVTLYMNGIFPIVFRMDDLQYGGTPNTNDYFDNVEHN